MSAAEKELEDSLLECLYQAVGELQPDGSQRYESRALSAYADAIRLLAKRGRLKITKEYGRMVFAIEIEKK